MCKFLSFFCISRAYIANWDHNSLPRDCACLAQLLITSPRRAVALFYAYLRSATTLFSLCDVIILLARGALCGPSSNYRQTRMDEWKMISVQFASNKLLEPTRRSGVWLLSFEKYIVFFLHVSIEEIRNSWVVCYNFLFSEKVCFGWHLLRAI